MVQVVGREFVLNYLSILETSAVITTVLQFLTGVLVCRKYFQKKSTGDSSGFPFVCGFLSCSLWLRYGTLINDQVVILVNTIGTLLFFLFVITYYIFTVNKKSYVRQFGIAFTFLILTTTYAKYFEDDTTKAIKLMGFICCFVTVLFFGAPLTMLLHVIRVRNSESLPLPLIVASFLVSLQWVIYGVIVKDQFIQIPNFLGCMLSAIQLFLFVIYPPKNFAGPSYKLIDQNQIF